MRYSIPQVRAIGDRVRDAELKEYLNEKYREHICPKCGEEMVNEGGFYYCPECEEEDDDC